MTKLICDICKKEFDDNTTDFEFFLHMVQNHKEEVEKTAKNIDIGLKELKKKKSQ